MFFALYLALRVFLALLHNLLYARAEGATKYHEEVTQDAEELLEGCPSAEGTDRLSQARRNLKVSNAAARQEKAEDRAMSCLASAERVGKIRSAVAGYAGRFSPYLAGKIDVVLGFLAADQMGYGPAFLSEVLRAVIGGY